MNKLLRSAVVLFVLVLSFSIHNHASAAAPFEDNFDSYTSGASLIGQGGWTGSGVNITDTGCVSGNCAYPFSYGNYIIKTGNALFEGSIDVDLKVTGVPSTYDYPAFISIGNHNGTYADVADIFKGTNSGFKLVDNRSNVLWDNLSINSWYTLSLSWVISGGACHFYVDLNHSGSPIEAQFYGNQATTCWTSSGLSSLATNGIDTMYVYSALLGGGFYLDNIRATHHQNFFAPIKNTPSGTLNLQSGPDISSSTIKTLPEDWIMYVASTTDTSDNTVTADGFKWYQVTDPTDNVSGWMVGENASGTISYLPYDSTNQTSFESDSSDYVATSSRAAIILDAIDNYYSTSTGGSLYDSTSGISSLATGFPEQVVPGIAAQEDGGATLGLNNENISFDYGHGIMQLTFNAWAHEPSDPHATFDNRGYGSLIDIPACASINTNDYINCYTNAGTADTNPKHYQPYAGNSSNPTYKYYTNTLQSFYSNIKDGLQVLSDKYATYSYINTSTTVGSTTYSADDRKDISATANYNGACGYVDNVATRLDNITDYFSTASTSSISSLILKMHTAGTDAICAQLHSPATVSIYDSKGNVAGVIDGEVKNTFPLAVVDKDEKLVKILAAQDDNYIYKVVGTGKGVYGFDITIKHGKEVKEFHAKGIPTKPGETHVYSVDKAALAAGRADAVTIQVDSDGDGKIERIVKSGPILNAEAFGVKRSNEAQ